LKSWLNAVALVLAVLTMSACQPTVVKSDFAQRPCVEISGIESIYSADIVVFGDYHGTNEPPRIFADAVCALVRQWSDYTIVIGLEIPVSFNLTFQKLGQLDARERARQIRAHPFWDEFRDGRHSEAMLLMTQELASLAAISSGRVELIALERPDWDLEGAKLLDQRMRALQARHALIFVGNAHARRFPTPQQTSAPFAQNLVDAGYRVLSLNIKPGGGEGWFCSPNCQRHSLGSSPDGEVARIVVKPCARAACPYDDFYYVPELSISRLAE
jgi:hypothetical protein